MRWCFLIAATVTLDVAGAALARADDIADDPNVEVCLGAAESAQPLIKQRRLRSARAKLEVCARDVCPKLARMDCQGWLDDVVRAIPSIVVAAREVRDGSGYPIEEVRVVEDGVVIATRVDSTPIELDPGVHALRLERKGWPVVETRFTLAEGETRRVVDAVWQVARAPSAPLYPPADGRQPPARAPIPWSVYALAGAGILAAGAGAAFELTGLARRSDLDGSCKSAHSCSQADVDAARNVMRMGDVTIGAGALLLGAATYLVLTRPNAGAPPRVGISVALLPTGGFACLGGDL
jgi:hypothetical protein